MSSLRPFLPAAVLAVVAMVLPAAPAVDFMKHRERVPFRILTTDGFFYPNYGALLALSTSPYVQKVVMRG